MSSLTQTLDCQPDPVRHVLALARMTDIAARDRIAAVAYPGHTETVAEIADHLAWIRRLELDGAADVLSEYHECPVTGSGLIEAAEQLIDELTADALMTAQLLASLAARGAA